MNKDRFKRTVGKIVRVRPVPWDIRDDGRHVVEADDDWRVTSADASVGLLNERTRLTVELEWDNVHNWHSPHFVILRSRIIMGVPDIGYRTEPLMPLLVVRPTPDEVLTQAVRDAAPTMPGWLSANRNEPNKINAVLDDEDRRDDWFATLMRDENGAALLADPFDPTSGLRVFIPVAFLYEAHRKVADRKRMEMFDPLDDWPV